MISGLGTNRTRYKEINFSCPEHLFPKNGRTAIYEFSDVIPPASPPPIIALHKQDWQSVKNLITNPNNIAGFIQNSGLIFYNPDNSVFATREADKTLIQRFFQEVPMPYHCFSFANAEKIRDLTLSNAPTNTKVNLLGGTNIARAVIGNTNISNLRGSTANFEKLLSQIGCSVANHELDKAIWRWGFKQSQEELNKRGIFLDEQQNKIYLVDIGEQHQWRDCPIKIVRGNNIATVNLANFPQEAFIRESLHGDNTCRCTNTIEDLKSNLIRLGFNIASDIETAYFVRTNEQARAYLTQKYAEVQTSSSKLSELARIMAQAKFDQKGATNIEVIEVQGTPNAKGYSTKILLVSNPEKQNHYGFLLKVSDNGVAPVTKLRDYRFIANACTQISHAKKLTYKPCILYVTDIDPKNWTARFEPKTVEPLTTASA